MNEDKVLSKDNMFCLENKTPYITGDVIQYGIARSGTTVVWQVLSKLIERAWKTHDYIPYEENRPAIITYRDPRDVIISRWRTEWNKNPKTDIITDRDLMIWTNSYKSDMENIRMYGAKYPNDKILFLCYEDYFSNTTYILDKLQEFFDIKIPLDMREMINNDTSVENNKKLQSTLNGFSEADFATGLHGNHIHNGTPSNWKIIIPSNLHDFVTELLYNELVELGYE